MDLTVERKKQTLINALSLGIQAKVPTLLIGHPGQAKTSITEAIARVLKWKIYVLAVPGKKDPAQVQGLPELVDGCVEWRPYKHLLELSKEENSLFMLDDLGEANRDMQAYYLGILYGRRFGDLVLENTSMVAAANPEGGELHLSPALSNRLFHLPWSISALEFAADMQAGFPAPQIPIVGADWKTLYLPQRRELVGSFLMRTGDMLNPTLDGEQVKVEQKEAFPSMRTWDFVTQLLAVYDAATFNGVRLNDLELVDMLVSGCVGKDASSLYFKWFQERDLPTPQELLEDPERKLTEIDVFGKRTDRLWIVVSNMTRYTLLKNDAFVWKQAWRVLGIIAKKGKTAYGVTSARILNVAANRPAGVKDPPELVHYLKMLSVTGKI